MGKRAAIIHFLPLELYPPVQNLITEWEKSNSYKQVIILTTYSVKSLPAFCSSSDNFRIVRLGKSGMELPSWRRYLTYGHFYLFSLLLLIWNRVRLIMYYETVSSFPAYIYKRFISMRASIFIHYHEYTTQSEYRTGPALIRWFHKWERWLLSKASWVSQTNDDRLKKFAEDINEKELKNMHVLPNYPPSSWHSVPGKEKNRLLRIVYVGAVSISTLYLREFVEWVGRHPSSVQWDIYTSNITQESKDYFTSLNYSNIKIKGIVPYNMLHKVLPTYHVGVILYRGHIQNYIYNAPNKLFEYLACGLDVWFPRVMLGCLPYQHEGSIPRVVALDFDHLDELGVKDYWHYRDLPMRKINFFCETAFQFILEELNAHAK